MRFITILLCACLQVHKFHCYLYHQMANISVSFLLLSIFSCILILHVESGMHARVGKDKI